MLHFTCDMCGKKLRPGDGQHFVVKIDTFAAEEPGAITEADLEEDHMEAVSALLQENGDSADLDDTNKQFRYDLCSECKNRFVQDPLGKESAHKMFFSKN